MDQYYQTRRAEGGTSGALALIGVCAVLIAVFCVLYLPFVFVFLFMG